MSNIITAALDAAARAAEDDNRGKLLHRIPGGREYRLTAPDTMTIAGGGPDRLVHQVEGVDLLDALT